MSSRSHLRFSSRVRYAYSLCAAFLAMSFCSSQSEGKPRRSHPVETPGLSVQRKQVDPRTSHLQLRRVAKSRAERRDWQRQSNRQEQNSAYLDQLLSRVSPGQPKPASAGQFSEEPAPALVAQQDTALLRQLRQHAVQSAQRLVPKTTAKEVGKPMTGFAQEAEGRAASFRLQAGECYLIAAVSETSMRSLTTSLWTPLPERHVTITGSQTPFAAIRPRDAGLHQLIVRPAGGQGRYAAAIFQFECPD